MFESLFLTSIIFCLTLFQSVIGIGVLVLGTPLLLILDFELTKAMFYLLPISFLTSLFNFIIHSLKHPTKNYLNEKAAIKLYVLVCLPFVFVGLFFLKMSSRYINFDFLVSLVILISVFLKNKEITLWNSKWINKYAAALIGFVHGLTNSGGTLMTLFVLRKNNNNKKLSIKKIHFFYMLLAGTQYLVLMYLFDNPTNFIEKEIFYLLIIILVSSLIGFKLNEIMKNNYYSMIIDIMAILASLTLILKIFFSA
tara:strand:- start:4 stop:762 length:759 start_codon:yes stop_codon:yes gene_type:complete